jgi:hypothetical protein
MSHTVARTAFILVVASAALTGVPRAGDGAQRQNAAPARQAPPPVVAQPAAPPVVEQQTAEETREQLRQLFEKYPPAVARVFKLDPSLMSNESYLAPYPLLGAFLTQHPQVVHNPGYFLGNFGDDGYYNDPHRGARDQTLAVLGGLGFFFAFLVIVGVLAWLIRLVVMHRRWNRLSKVQFETHSKLLERFTSNEELLAYVQTPAGRRFLEAAPVPLQEAPSSIAAPLSRILWSAQAGIVLAVVGFALYRVSGRFTDEAAQVFTVAGVLMLSLGAGFVLSAVAAYALSRKLGLLDPPVVDHA